MSDSKNERICEICESSFPAEAIQLVTLGEDLPPNFRRRFNSCTECQIREQLAFFKERYELMKNSNEQLKNENTLFRTIMLKPETMEALANEPLAPPTRLYIAQHKIGWEQFSLDTILYWLEVFEAHVNCFASLANVKASKEEIKNRVKEKIQETQALIKKNQEAPKVVTKKASTAPVKLTAYDKAVAAFVKIGKTEVEARDLVSAMTAASKPQEG